MPVTTERLYGMIAEFHNPADLLRAVQCARREGYTALDAFSPYPVDGLAEELGFHKTRVPLVMFLGGLTGAVGGYLLQYWISALDYPINIGGRPYNSWPAFIPVIFEMTVLISALAGMFGLLALCGLPMPYHPMFNAPRFALASRDRFFLCVLATDPKFDPESTRQFLTGLHPQDVSEVPL